MTKWILKKARIKLARWVRLHPYNINQKVEVIVEHFREHVSNTCWMTRQKPW